ncbi:MAG: hypothetical protein ACLPID_10470 [Beijerinckiaceae bacterium]
MILSDIHRMKPLLSLKLPLSANFDKTNSAPQELLGTNATDSGTPSAETWILLAQTAKRDREEAGVKR